MTNEQILEICNATPNVGKVTHAEFAQYALPLTHRQKTDDGWRTVEALYMRVDGKLAMANEDHRRQSARLMFLHPTILVNNDEQITILVIVESSIYGMRHGIATALKKPRVRTNQNGKQTEINGAEQEFPFEVAETSAIGRALGAMGYGLFPGAGLASANDMLRANDRADAQATKREAMPNARSTPQTQHANTRNGITTIQRNKLIELFITLHGTNEDAARAGLDALFQAEFKHKTTEATYEEGQRIMAKLLAEQKERKQK